MKNRIFLFAVIFLLLPYAFAQSTWHREAQIIKPDGTIIPYHNVGNSPQRLPTAGAVPGTYTVQMKICNLNNLCGDWSTPQTVEVRVGMPIGCLATPLESCQQGCGACPPRGYMYNERTGECEQLQEQCPQSPCPPFTSACIVPRASPLPPQACCLQCLQGFDYNCLIAIEPIRPPTPGVTICGRNYLCGGAIDSVCPSNYGANCGSICDPDCETCPTGDGGGGGGGGAVCGNGIREGNEQCDNGAANNGPCPATCSITCTNNNCPVCTPGSITGTVKNQDNQPLAPADVLLKRDLTTVSSTTTRQQPPPPPQGTYIFTGVNCGAYNLVASYPNYVPKTVSISLASGQQLIQDFVLTLGTTCERDCTFANDNIVHASCDGINGCSFCDISPEIHERAKTVCDNSQVGWIRDYDAANYVECPSGCPQVKTETQATVTCSSGTLVKMYRIITYNGKPVKLVVAVCG
ncbi:carboxypeptidase regulatory-like domain-containing protein [Candidatus Woesearchaeota archaeon]|nr:carboxypeptidase regulatory-like domain-containing protein [Candidatus Woesearchaeota archaeon]